MDRRRDGRGNSVSFCDLPDNILTLILSLLSYEDAAKTSIVSKKWKNIWLMFLTAVKIDLDEDNFTERQAFIDFARHSISISQQRNLCEFHLKISNPSDIRPHIENWIQFAIDRTVEVLDLDFSADFELPHFLFNFVTLRVLKLTSCNLMALEAANFAALKKLFVARARLSSGSLKNLVMGCPVLETLSLDKCRELDGIDISSPTGARLMKFMINECTPLIDGVSINHTSNLESFKYSGSMIMFYGNGLDSLRDAHLDFGVEREFDNWGDNLCNMIGDLHRATVLSVCSYTVQVIHSGEEPLQIQNAEINVRHLILNIGLHRDELPGIAFMLRSCPLLNRLSIEMGDIITLDGYEYPLDAAILDEKSFWELEEITPFNCLQNHLERVEMNNFRATENALAMVEFLLSNARTLREMDIVTSKQMDPQTHSEEINIIFGSVRQYFRAAPNARVFVS